MITIYTVITNNYVELMPQEYIPGFRYVCFTDGLFEAPEPWKTIKIQEKIENPTQLSRHPKILSHKYFSDGEVTVYFDGKEKLNPSAIIPTINLTKDYDFISLLHRRRYTYCDEMMFMYLNGLITKSQIIEKTENLKNNGYVFQNHVCTHNHCIVRKVSQYVKQFELEWWNQYLNFDCYGKRDQLPFGIAYSSINSEKHSFLSRDTHLDYSEYAKRNVDNTMTTRPSNCEIAKMQSYLTKTTNTPLITELMLCKPISYVEMGYTV